MDHNDRQAIEGLFHKLGQVEQQSPSRDAEAEHFIAGQIARQPGAPYFMAQTIVMQDHALNSAQARIEELEYQLQASRQQAGQGGFLSRMFGGGAPAPAPRPAPRPVSSHGQGYAPAQPQAQAATPWGGAGPAQPGYGRGYGQPQGGGFLAGAAQTAMGVAGGMMLGNAVMGMFGGDEAQAAPAPEAAPEPVQEEAEAYADEGGWDEEI